MNRVECPSEKSRVKPATKKRNHSFDVRFIKEPQIIHCWDYRHLLSFLFKSLSQKDAINKRRRRMARVQMPRCPQTNQNNFKVFFFHVIISIINIFWFVTFGRLEIVTIGKRHLKFFFFWQRFDDLSKCSQNQVLGYPNRDQMIVFETFIRDY